MNKSVFIFPAFVLKYLGSEVEMLSAHNIDLKEKLKSLSSITGIDITDFNIENNDFINNEIKNQLLTYLISCLVSDVLKEKKIKSDYASGLSMGIYAALYHVGSISFNSGALMILKVYQHIRSLLKGGEFEMISIIGLSRKDLQILITKSKLNCEIVIKNGKYSFIISGNIKDISKIYNLAKNEGALHLNRLPVNTPYHSSYLKNNKESFDKIFSDIEITDSDISYISTIDQREISESNIIKEEIIRNIIYPLDWNNMINRLLKLNAKTLYECGPGESLYKSSKFIKGDFKILTLKQSLS